MFTLRGSEGDLKVSNFLVDNLNISIYTVLSYFSHILVSTLDVLEGEGVGDFSIKVIMVFCVTTWCRGFPFVPIGSHVPAVCVYYKNKTRAFETQLRSMNQQCGTFSTINYYG